MDWAAFPLGSQWTADRIPAFESVSRFVSVRCPVPVIGIIGGIGSGKSAVARWLQSRRKVLRIDADAIGHEVLRQESVKTALKKEFGDRIFDDDGEVNRGRLGRLVFGGDRQYSESRCRLEQIVHPRIRQAISETISRERTSNTSNQYEAILLDAAILLEAGWKDVCQKVVFIDTPIETRRRRVHESRGWNAEDLQRREASQMSVSEKQSRADVTITNDSTIEHAGRQLEEILNRLISTTV